MITADVVPDRAAVGIEVQVCLVAQEVVLTLREIDHNNACGVAWSMRTAQALR
jgi:hypothetical protein